MARDLNKLFDDIQRSRPVYITEDGRVETETEAAQNATQEENADGTPKPRTRLKPEVFGSSPAVRIQTSVLAAMHTEAARHPGETGGIVVGPDDSTITEIFLSGANARRSNVTFVLDPDYLQPLLEEAEKRGLRFLGVWHSHPEGVAELSGTDRATARRILADAEYGVRRLLLPLSVRADGGFETRVFVAEGDGPMVTEARLVLLSDPEPPNPPAPALALPPGESDRQLLLPFAEKDTAPAFVRARLRADRLALEARGWTVRLHRLTEPVSAWAMAAYRNGVRLLFHIPVEYPLGPPAVYADRGNSRRPIAVSKLPEAQGWSSLSSLSELAEEAAEAVATLDADGRTPARRRRSVVATVIAGAGKVLVEAGRRLDHGRLS